MIEPGGEQRQLRQTVRAFLAEHCPTPQLCTGDLDVPAATLALWQSAADELGLQEMLVPAEYGGLGLGPTERALLFEELGRALAPGPYLVTLVWATEFLVALGNRSACERWLPSIASGQVTAAVVLDAPLTAKISTTGYRVSGTGKRVVDGRYAGLFLVGATVEERPAVFAVEFDPQTVTLRSPELLDPTRDLTDIHFDDAVATLINDLDSDAALLTATAAATTAHASEQLGAANRCIELAVDYANTRTQFGHPIGSFQSIKHLVSEAFVEVEAARALARHMAAADEDCHPYAAAMLQIAAAHAFIRAAGTCIQVHGGIGFTWEHPCHLYFKRATTDRYLFGSAEQHLDTIAADRIDKSERAVA